MMFEDIPVSTQTFTIRTNIKHIHLQAFFNFIEPEPPRASDEGPVIIFCKYQQHQKGVLMVKEKKRKPVKQPKVETRRNFLNCVSMIILVDKKINVKLFQNGVFQLTGCRSIVHAKACVVHILLQLKQGNCFVFQAQDSNFIVYLKSAMRNIDFDLGFKIKRDNLTDYLHKNTTYKVPYTIGNKIDVKIRIPIDRHELEKLPILCLYFQDDHSYLEKWSTFKECLHVIEPEPKRIKYKLENKFISISIFQNGKVLLSSVDETFQKKYYEWLIQFIHSIRPVIENVIPRHVTFFPGLASL